MKAVVGFLSGIILGGAAALLLAPESGEKTREELKKRSQKLRDELEDQAKQGKEKLEDMRKKGTEKLEELKETSQDALEDAAKRLNTQQGEAPRSILDKS